MRIALDIETNRKHDQIWLCCTYDIDTKEVKAWTQPSEDLNQFLKKATLIIGHNGISFDFPILNKVWNTKITMNQVQDTLVMSRLSNPSREGGHSLAKLATLVGRTKKEFEDFDNGLTEEMIEYCKEDVVICGELYLYLLQELRGFSEDSIKLEHDVARIIAQQERNGFMLDVTKAVTLVTDWKTDLSNIEEGLQEVFPPDYIKFKGKPRNMQNVVTYDQIPEEHKCRIVTQ